MENTTKLKMTKFFNIIILITVLIYTMQLFAAEQKTLKLPYIPDSVEKFLELRKNLPKTPHGGAALFIAAMLVYGNDKELGMKCLTIAYDRTRLSSSSRYAVYKGWGPNSSERYLIKQCDKFPWLGKIYIQGTKADTFYKLPHAPYIIKFGKQFNDYKTYMKVFVETTSGNMPRPLNMVKNNKGIWKVQGSSSVFVGPSKMPKKEVNDDL